MMLRPITREVLWYKQPGNSVQSPNENQSILATSADRKNRLAVNRALVVLFIANEGLASSTHSKNFECLEGQPIIGVAKEDLPAQRQRVFFAADCTSHTAANIGGNHEVSLNFSMWE